MFRKYLIVLVVLLAPINAIASDGGAQWYTFGPFLDSSGVLYRDIRIDVSNPGTAIDKDYWTAEVKSAGVLGAHPLVDVDSDGIVGAFFDGTYRFVIKDTTGLITIADWDNVKVTSDTSTMWEGNAGTSFPSVTTANSWQMAVKHSAGNILQDIGINDGTNFVSILNDSSLINETLNGTDYADSYGSFCAAVSAIGATVKTLIIRDVQAEATGCTTPTTLTLKFQGVNGSLAPATGIFITIESPIVAPGREIFTCVGSESCIRFPSFPTLGEGHNRGIRAEWWGFSSRATAAVNSTALNAALASKAIDANIYTPAGIFPFDAKILMVGKRKRLFGDGTFLNWSGSTAVGSIAFQLGDGGTTATIETEIRNLVIASNGAETGLKITAVTRSNFYGLHIIGNTGMTSGQLIDLADISIIHNFYGLVLKQGFDGVNLKSNSNSINFYGTVAEDQEGASVRVKAGQTVNLINFNGGTFESSVTAFHLTHVTNTLSIDNVYFEANTNHIIVDHIASGGKLSVVNSRFTSPLNAGTFSIDLSAIGTYYIERNEFRGGELYRLNNNSAKVIATGNISPDASAESLIVLGSHINMETSGDGHLRLNTSKADTGVKFNKNIKITPGGYIENFEVSEPAAPAVNGARLYSKDNGSGKTQLCVRFNTGVSQCFATQP